MARHEFAVMARKTCVVVMASAAVMSLLPALALDADHITTGVQYVVRAQLVLGFANFWLYGSSWMVGPLKAFDNVDNDDDTLLDDLFDI